MTADVAMKPDAPILLAALRTNGCEGPDRPTNVAAHIQFQRGDLEAGFARADYVVERDSAPRPSIRATSSRKKPSALERRRSRDDLLFDPGHLQRAHADRHTCSKCPRAKSRWCRPRLAAASAARPRSTSNRVRAALAKSGRPVKMMMTRGEVLRATGPTSGSNESCKIGATRTANHRRADLDGLRGGRFPARRSRLARCVARAVQRPQLADRRLRRGRQPARSQPIAHRARPAPRSPANR